MRQGENKPERCQPDPRNIISASIPVVCALFLSMGTNLLGPKNRSFKDTTDYAAGQKNLLDAFIPLLDCL